MSLCYPKYDVDNDNRMVAPFIQLTIGDILKDSPGFLNSLSYTVEESSTWEMQDGLQFPKYINVSCDFKYIGKELPEKGGKLLQLGKNNRYVGAIRTGKNLMKMTDGGYVEEKDNPITN